MSLSDLTIGSAALHLLGCSLLHFLWQGTLLTLLLGVVLVTARNWTAQSRYALCCGALALMALCPIVTIAYLDHSAGEAPSVSLLAANTDHGAQLWQGAHASLLERVTEVADRTIPWVVVVWITGVLLLLTRAIGASMTVRRLKTASIVPASESLRAMARNMAERLGITQAFEVFVSTAATAPAVIGWLKPVILFPVASLAGLAPEQLEAMLAHELAHIRRRDYLVNALQVVMETLLFYHPAVWWVSRQIRREREHCCDDVAVAVTGSPFVYAKALFLLEEQRAMAPQLMLGGNGGQLSMRIKRLLTGKQSVASTYGAAGWMLTVMLLVLTGGLVISAVTIGKARAQSTGPVSYTQRTATGQDVPEGDPRLKLLEGTDPAYPAAARAAHVSGEVQIAIVVSPKGEVTEAHVVSGDPMLRQAALDAVRKYKFAPFAEDGSEPAKTIVKVNFVLYGEAPAQSPALSGATQATATGVKQISNTPQLRLLESAEAEYPPMAKAFHVTGKVDVYITVSPEGKVINADVASGLPALRQAALDAASRYKFAPFADSSDKPATGVVTIDFSLPEGALGNDPKPDLSCSYYDHGVEHPGTCEILSNDSQPYYCRRNDGDKQTQEQTGCQMKINSLEAWESRHNNKSKP